MPKVAENSVNQVVLHQTPTPNGGKLTINAKTTNYVARVVHYIARQNFALHAKNLRRTDFAPTLH